MGKVRMRALSAVDGGKYGWVMRFAIAQLHYVNMSRFGRSDRIMQNTLQKKRYSTVPNRGSRIAIFLL
jgi:hypothetical protein